MQILQIGHVYRKSCTRAAGKVFCVNRGSSNRFQVVRTAQDGNCLFNALVQSTSLNTGRKVALSLTEERHLARQLRADVVTELRRSREFVEGFLPVPFEDYVLAMSADGTWAGEPELSMSSIVLRSAIEVYDPDMSLIARYELAAESLGPPIPILYYRDLHYDALKLD